MSDAPHNLATTLAGLRSKEEKPKGIEETYRELQEILGQMKVTTGGAVRASQLLVDALKEFRPR